MLVLVALYHLQMLLKLKLVWKVHLVSIKLFHLLVIPCGDMNAKMKVPVVFSHPRCDSIFVKLDPIFETADQVPCLTLMMLDAHGTGTSRDTKKVLLRLMPPTK